MRVAPITASYVQAPTHASSRGAECFHVVCRTAARTSRGIDPRRQHLSFRLSTSRAVVEEVTAMINAAYAAGEHGMWRPDTPRIFEAEARALLEAGELMVLRRDGVLAGCVRVRVLDAA